MKPLSARLLDVFIYLLLVSLFLSSICLFRLEIKVFFYLRCVRSTDLLCTVIYPTGTIMFLFRYGTKLTRRELYEVGISEFTIMWSELRCMVGICGWNYEVRYCILVNGLVSGVGNKNLVFYTTVVNFRP